MSVSIMSPPVGPPVDQPVSEVMQMILIVGSYFIWAGLILYSLKLGYNERTSFYTILVLAAGLCAVYEPIYDNVLMLYFYRPGQISAFTSFNLPQPVWTFSGYGTLYASVALFFTRDVARGMAKRTFWTYCAAELLSSCLFEIIAINGGAYAYWGPHAFRIFKYPICIGLLETAQALSFSVLASYLRILISNTTSSSESDSNSTTPTKGIKKGITYAFPYLSLFFLFPFTFMGSNIGLGGPLIVALHSSAVSESLVQLGSIATMIGVGVALYVLSLVVQVEGTIKLESPRYNGNGHSDLLGT